MMLRHTVHAIAVLTLAGFTAACSPSSTGTSFEIPPSASSLPEGLPKELWLDLPTTHYTGMTMGDELWVSAVSNVLTPKEVLVRYRDHLTKLGWTPKAQESTDEAPVHFLQDFHKADATIQISAYSFHDNDTMFDLTYTTETLKGAYQAELEEKRKAFGEEDPQARAKWNAVLEAYKTCQSYTDNATFRSFEYDDGHIGKPFGSGKFITAYRREGNFRFEHVDGDGGWRHVIHRDKEGARAFWDLTGEEEEMELAMLLAGAYGVTNEASGIVIDLFLAGEPGLEGHSGGVLKGLGNMQFDTAADNADSGTFVLKGLDADASPYTLWIDSATKVIRKIEFITPVDENTYFERFEFDAEMNVDIPDDQLAYRRAGIL